MTMLSVLTHGGFAEPSVLRCSKVDDMSSQITHAAFAKPSVLRFAETKKGRR